MQYSHYDRKPVKEAYRNPQRLLKQLEFEVFKQPLPTEVEKERQMDELFDRLFSRELEPDRQLD